MSGTHKQAKTITEQRRESGRVPFSLWLTVDEKALLEDLARKERRPMAEQVRHLIEKAAA